MCCRCNEHKKFGAGRIGAVIGVGKYLAGGDMRSTWVIGQGESGRDGKWCPGGVNDGGADGQVPEVDIEERSFSAK